MKPMAHTGIDKLKRDLQQSITMLNQDGNRINHDIGPQVYSECFVTTDNLTSFHFLAEGKGQFISPKYKGPFILSISM